MDRIDPYADAREPEFPDRAMRSFIAPLFGAMSMDTHVQLIAAWNAIVSHPSYPATPGLVTADMVDDPQLKAMLEAFDAMPEVLGPDGEFIALGTPEGRAVVKAGWLRQMVGEGLWPADAEQVVCSGNSYGTSSFTVHGHRRLFQESDHANGSFFGCDVQTSISYSHRTIGPASSDAATWSGCSMPASTSFG